MSDAGQPEKRNADGRFAKGASGNPGGRPKGHAEFRQACQDAAPRLLAELMARVANRDEKGVPTKDLVMALEVIAQHAGFITPRDKAAADAALGRLFVAVLDAANMTPEERAEFLREWTERHSE